ncbi:hypothetical protein [Sphingobium bisphenolivorans]|uniref:hypothetical protein n=1 Tax=Sphingobium bisphenolivorans TaxID=1335760 RepID=UPI0030832DF3
MTLSLKTGKSFGDDRDSEASESMIGGTHRHMTGSCFMRAMILPLLLLPAACGKDEDRQPGVVANIVDQEVSGAADNAPAVTNNSAVEPAEEPAPQTRQAPVASAIPPALQGRWTGLNDNCNNRSAELELKITRDSLIFHESVGTVMGVSSRPNNHVSVDAAFTGEGQSWTKKLELRPSANGRELTIINDGTAVTRKRC